MAVIELDEVTSTNDYIKRRCGELPDGSVVCARIQTAGRGRHGHGWAADEGMLPLSILLKDPPERENLTARAGLAVCDAVESLCAVNAMIKWPNDIIVNSRKICGILCESTIVKGQVNVIVGIGVNVSQSAEFFENAGLPHAASLLMLTGNAPARKTLAEEIAGRVTTRAAMPFSECYEEYARRLINIGKQVKLIFADGERIAKAVGVSGNGYLICRADGREFEVSAGEVSVRGMDGYL